MRRLWLLYLVLIFGLSSVPGSSVPGRWPPHADKLVHFLLYAGLGFSYVANSGVARRGARRALLTALMVGAVVGLADEIYQALVPGRSPSPVDWLADLAGAGAGAVIALATGRFAARPESETTR